MAQSGGRSSQLVSPVLEMIWSTCLLDLSAAVLNSTWSSLLREVQLLCSLVACASGSMLKLYSAQRSRQRNELIVTVAKACIISLACMINPPSATIGLAAL